MSLTVDVLLMPLNFIDAAILSSFPARRTSRCRPAPLPTPISPRFCVGMETIRVLGFMNKWRNRDNELMKMARIRGIGTVLLTFIVKKCERIALGLDRIFLGRICVEGCNFLRSV